MVYKSKKAKKMQRERFLKKILLKFFLPFFLIFIFSLFFLNSAIFKIKNIKVENNKNISEESIKKIFQDSLEGQYLKIYSKNNFLFYPESEIENNILEEEIGVSSLDISYDGIISRNIKVKIEEKIPIYLFCKSLQKKECYFVESDGKIFSKYNEKWVKKEKGDFLFFIKDFKNNLPMKILAEKDFAKLKSLIFDLEKINLKIMEVVILDNLKLSLRTKSGSALVIFLNQDFEKLLESLEKIVNKKDLEIDIKKKDFKNKVEYINLTFGENIYYCMGGSECADNF